MRTANPLEYARAGLSRSPNHLRYLNLSLFAVVVILSATVLIFPRMQHGYPAKEIDAWTQLKELDEAIKRFESDVGRYPTTREGLAALVIAPARTSDWHGPYIQNLSGDPWGHPYVYTALIRIGVWKYQLKSAGPDDQPGTEDDIANQ